MKAVVATKNKIRRGQLKYLLGEAYPNSTVVHFDDVMLAAKEALCSPTDVFFTDPEGIRFIQMLKKSKEGIIIVILAENDLQGADAKEKGAKSLIIDPITNEKMIDAIEGVFV